MGNRINTIAYELTLPNIIDFKIKYKISEIIKRGIQEVIDIIQQMFSGNANSIVFRMLNTTQKR